MVLATGVSASAHSTTAADVTTLSTTATASPESFADLLLILAQLPEFQGKTLAEIQAEIQAAMQAQIQADIQAEAAEKAAEAQKEAAEKAAETTEVDTDTDTDNDNDNVEDGDVDNQHDAKPQVVKPMVLKPAPPREESHESSSAKRHEHGGHDR
jgi:surface antigen